MKLGEATVTQAFEDGDELVVTAEAAGAVVQVRLPLAMLGSTELEQRRTVWGALRRAFGREAAKTARGGLLGRMDLDTVP